LEVDKEQENRNPDNKISTTKRATTTEPRRVFVNCCNPKIEKPFFLPNSLRDVLIDCCCCPPMKSVDCDYNLSVMK